jgi:glutaminyl-tRNA synthetase
MPTLVGLRRRGYTAEAINDLCNRTGVSKTNTVIEIQLLEHCIREDLNKRAPRVMGVLNPLRVVIDNYPEGQAEEFEIANTPDDPSAGTRRVPFSREIFIDQEDFREEPPKKFFRLSPGREVRLRGAYFITCTSVEKNDAGEITALHCTYDAATRGGDAPDGRKVKGTLHWVAAPTALDVEVRLYDRLFNSENPGAVEDYKSDLNPHSLDVITHAKLEPSVASARAGDRFQFERTGYFCVDPDSRDGRLVFNRTVTLKDAWAKIEQRG